MPVNPLMIFLAFYIFSGRNHAKHPLLTPLAISSALHEAQVLLDVIERVGNMSSQFSGLLQDSEGSSSIKNLLEIVEKSYH